MNPFLATIVESAWLGLAVAGLLIALLPWAKRDGIWRAAIAGFAILLTLRYIHWRFTETIPPISEPLNFTVGSLFFALELAASVGAILSLVTLMRTRNRSSEVEANRAWLFGRRALPSASVFICTYNEEEEILERTIIGAMAMNYANYDVWVLDDGRRDWLKQLSEKLGCNYLTRPDNEHAKAGNINHALQHLRETGRAPDFVSILDADFVPSRDFLWRALTLFREKDVGIVQTPQHFSNPDPIQANLKIADTWPDEQRYFFEVVMPARDAWGTAFCCGTSSVIRYEALRQIGGFPTDSVTEDYLLTLRMQQNGYRTVYLNERLSLGLAPEGLKEYVTQRSRWCLGFVQIFRGKDGPFNPDNNLRLVDRVALLESFLYWSATYSFKIACLIVPILYLGFDIQAVDVDLQQAIHYFLPYFIIHVAMVAWLSEERILPIMVDISQLLAAREIVSAVMVGLFRPHGHKFEVTAKGGDRGATVIQWRMMWMYLLLLGLTVASIVWAFYLDTDRDLQASSSISLYWSWYNIVVLILTAFVAIERPRNRKNERFAIRDPFRLFVNGAASEFVAQDISVNGIRFHGPAPGKIGERAVLLIEDVRIQGRISRATEHDFAIQIEDTLLAHAKMIQYIYSGQFRNGVRKIQTLTLAKRVLARVWG